MNTTLLLSFIGTVLIIAFTPGPSVLLATANSMNHGAKKTIGTILGDLSANTIQIILSSLGLATIINSSGDLFNMIKWLGVAYLIYMGLTKIFSQRSALHLSKKKKEKTFFNLYLEGFLMSASNPKAIVFLAAFFPLFIDQQLPFLPQVFMLGMLYLMIDGISLLIYVYFASRLKNYLEDQEKIHFQNRIIGGLLIFSGVMLSMVSKNIK